MKEIDRAAVDRKAIRFFGRAALLVLGVIAGLLVIALLAATVAPKEHAHVDYGWLHSAKFASSTEV